MTLKVQPASKEETEDFVREHPAWTIAEGKLHREFRFADFVQAFGFMAEAALIAERSDHHPEWCNIYNVVAVNLVTHDAGGITQKDFDLASEMDVIAAKV